MRRRRLFGAIAVAAFLIVGAVPAAAVACPRTSVADIEDEVMCPVCKTPLGLAQEAPQADRERAFILARVERCESKGEIKAALAAEFGDEVLALPEDEGFDLAAYLVPAAALLGSLAAAGFALVRWRARRAYPSRGAGPGGDAPASGGAGVAPDRAAQERLDRDLERYDS